MIVAMLCNITVLALQVTLSNLLNFDIYEKLKQVSVQNIYKHK